LLNS